MASTEIVIKGAREHNLRSVDLVIPRNQLVCLTGVSGSGKSSLAFDTLYAEGQRRYIESLSSFARQFLGQMPKPDVDFVSGLSPSISISQKTAGKNPRSTVGTITEIYDYLRVLFARIGQGNCPSCGQPISAQSREQIVGRILQIPEGRSIQVLAPLIRGQKGHYKDLFSDLLKQGFVRARVDGDVIGLSEDIQLDRRLRHDIEVVVDRLVTGATTRTRLAEAVELALKVGQGVVIVSIVPEAGAVPVRRKGVNSIESLAEPAEGFSPSAGDPASEDLRLSANYACTTCNLSFESPTPQLFSFNSPHGMCLSCDGLGEIFTFDPAIVINHPGRSVRSGCADLFGKWKDLNRWRHSVLQGVAETIERLRELPTGTLLDTPWRELPAELQDVWLWGTGQQNITFTWRSGAAPIKYGGKFEGFLPELLAKYKSSKGKAQRTRLEKYMRTLPCHECQGQRLNAQARAVTLSSLTQGFASTSASDPNVATELTTLTLPRLGELTIQQAHEFVNQLQLDVTQRLIAGELLKEIGNRLGFLLDVGLDYLTLNRRAPTLSGGEAQRIRLAGQVGCALVGVLYILDEPSIGLHPRDNERLLGTLEKLRDLGNTVLVVEHDEDTMRAADHVIDFGPGAGVRGGEVVAQGSLQQICQSPRSVTGKFLAGREKIEIPKVRRPPGESKLKLFGVNHHNLRHVDLEVPLGLFVCVTGVSGSGKSSLVNDVLAQSLHRELNRGEADPGEYDRLEGIEFLDKLIAIDQSPIGRTPRSNPGTYVKVFDEIRKLFTMLPDAKRKGYSPGRFSFNVRGGRCEACEGNGATKLDMDFLADIWVTCPVCEGRRFNRETLSVLFKGKSIADILDMEVGQAIPLFANIPKIVDRLQTLHDVGMDYVKIGQASPTLSGGESQRIKLARELTKRSTGRTLYLLDEPTTGLHFADVKLLLNVLHNFADAGNTVLVVEHNLDVIKTADWVIDMGPEGGARGGEILVAGTPEDVAGCPRSFTGQALAPFLGMKPARPSSRKPAKKKSKPSNQDQIVVRGARQHNLRNVDVTLPRDQMTVFCGPSGSGKSSLAMDTIYAEGQRRYVESLSSYARQFVGQMQKPELESIDGLSPAIAIEQKNLGNSPRSTVGTVTEIYDYLRVLVARLGTPHCPACQVPIGTQTVDQICDKVLTLPEGTRLYFLAPIELEMGSSYEELWTQLRSQGYVRIRANGMTHSLEEPPQLDRRRKHQIEVLVDRVVVKLSQRPRIAESLEAALSVGHGVVRIAVPEDNVPEDRWSVATHSRHMACEQCGRSFENLTPHHFSFNSPLGWCASCEGLGRQTGTDPTALLKSETATLRQ
ncbi:MAG: excinuclease ABC subunit UvrA, partial [Planctomycetota bacterium]|nr:excinuclease ABC subunit UvrA [Planctomycetota bacterium]